MCLGVRRICLKSGVGNLRRAFDIILVSLAELQFGKIEAGGRLGLRTLITAQQRIDTGAFWEKRDLLVMMSLTAYVHAIDHRADRILEACSRLLKLRQLIV